METGLIVDQALTPTEFDSQAHHQPSDDVQNDIVASVLENSRFVNASLAQRKSTRLYGLGVGAIENTGTR